MKDQARHESFTLPVPKHELTTLHFLLLLKKISNECQRYTSIYIVQHIGYI